MHNAFDGRGDHRRGVVGVNHLDARREEGLQLGNRCAHRFGGIECIAACGKAYPQAGCRLAVILGADRIALGAKFDPGDVTQAHL